MTNVTVPLDAFLAIVWMALVGVVMILREMWKFLTERNAVTDQREGEG